MAAGEINMKQISEYLKSFLTKKVENNAKKITEKIKEKMNTKFDELSTNELRNNRQEGRGSRNNQNNISDLTSESTALQEKSVEQVKKIR